MSEHDRYAEDLSAYALGALSDDHTRRVERHLAECADCRAEVDWMRAAVDTLPASVPQVKPPPELRARVMDAVQAEAALLRAAGTAADRPEPIRRPHPRWHSWRLGAALAAVCAAIAAAVVIAAGGTGARTVQAQVAPSLKGRASATLRITGTRAQLVVSGLPAPPADHVDELWVVPPQGQPRPAGTFVVRTGSVTLTLPVRAGDTVLVTLEPGAGTAVPTSTPFISAFA